jgi:hypothetical protein
MREPRGRKHRNVVFGIGLTDAKEGFTVAVECIHGLNEGLCDICYPKAVPAEAKQVRSRVARATAPTSTRKSTVDVGEQRIYHVTHVGNLAGILEAGALLADARPTVDISSAENRESRRTADVAGSTAASYVPFFLTPNATLWEGIRLGNADSRLSPESRHAVPSDFVILVSTVRQTAELEAVVADGDAAGSLTRFGSTEDGSERMLRRLHDDENSIIAAEFLVKRSFPFDLVTLIGVAHDKAREAIRPILLASAHKPKVVVYPPWFQRPEGQIDRA